MTSAKILIVDDEPANVRLLERLLQGAGYTQLEKTTDSRQVLALYQTFHPDLILLDLLMPHLDGVAVLGQVRSVIPSGEYVPVLVLTADATLDAKRRALAAGANDFLTKPFEQFEVVLRIRNLLDTRRLVFTVRGGDAKAQFFARTRTAGEACVFPYDVEAFLRFATAPRWPRSRHFVTHRLSFRYVHPRPQPYRHFLHPSRSLPHHISVPRLSTLFARTYRP
jgi:CheY-like chemotaxis protein